MKIKVIKIASIFFLTISAVIGQFFDFKTSDGESTSWGIIAIVIALVLGAFAIVVEFLEYKEKKKSKIETELNEQNRIKSLEKIQLGISNSKNPLVPFRASFTTKTIINENYAKEIAEFPTTNVTQIKTEYLRFVGSIKLSDSPYNFEEERPEKINCDSKDMHLINQLLEKKVIKRPSIEIEIIPQNSDDKIKFDYPQSEYSDLKNKIREIRIYDDIIYQDFRVGKWRMKSTLGSNLGVQNLLRAKIIVKAEYKKSSLPENMILPDFTNIILYFGENPVHLLSFSKEQLKNNQTSQLKDDKESGIKYENDLAKEMFQSYTQTFEIEITDELYNNQIRVFS